MSDLGVEGIKDGWILVKNVREEKHQVTCGNCEKILEPPYVLETGTYHDGELMLRAHARCFECAPENITGKAFLMLLG